MRTGEVREEADRQVARPRSWPDRPTALGVATIGPPLRSNAVTLTSSIVPSENCQTPM